MSHHNRVFAGPETPVVQPHTPQIEHAEESQHITSLVREFVTVQLSDAKTGYPL